MAEKDTGDGAAELLRGVLWLGRRLRAERPRGGVTLSGVGLLATLHRLGPMPAVRLAERENLQPQSLTRLLAALEREGCIARRRSETDRRETVIALTARGRVVLAEEMRDRRRWLERAMADALTKAERDALAKAATALLKLAQYEEAGPSGG